jgi:hypothetical protein
MPEPMDDLFGVPPLDLGESLAPQAPAPSRPSAKTTAKEYAPLLALLPLVAQRGGRAGIAALLQGFQQQRTQAQQLDRQSQMDAERQRQISEQERVRRATLAQTTANNEAQRRQQVLTSFQSGLEGLDSEEAVRAYLQLYGQQAQSVGLRPEVLEGFAMQAVTPTRLEKKEATRIIESAKRQYGDQAVGHTYTLKDGSQANWEELNRRAGVTLGQPTAASSILPDVPLDRQHAMALAAGNKALAATIEDAMKRQDAAKSQPADPQLASLNRQIAEMRLDNMKAAKETTGLPPRVSRQVDAQAKGFDSQPVVKRTQTMAEAVSFANSLDPNTKNPADDQALIYAFAKAMDPDSVVREGEYATVQKYAQSWAERFGFDVARVFTNTAFLTPQARANMKATIQQRYAPAKAQYDNVRRSYADRINRMTGGTDGDQYLIDYAGAFPQGQGSSDGGEWTQLGDGTRVRVKR